MAAPAASIKVIENDKKIMRGEFRGDFTRDTFDPMRYFSRVLTQQGRVQVDADWNEQVSIILHQIRSLACDLGSEHWGPEGNHGFAITPGTASDFNIGEGHYYVKGLLCEVGDEQSISYASQPNYPLPEDQTMDALLENQDGRQLLVYLDVWERHITYVSDDTIREVALGGADTAARAQVVWQVKIIHTSITSTGRGTHLLKRSYQTFLDEILTEIKPGTGKLCAKVKDKTKDDKNPCLVAPESRYRGAENQLYRVEIHNSGTANGGSDDATETVATYKWSRENASVIFPITSIEDTRVTLEHLGRDCRYGLKPNDWIEIADDDYILQNRAERLMQIESIDDENRQVTLKESPQSNVATDPLKHPYLRRWDQKEGDQNGIAVVESSPAGEPWVDLEDGIKIQFKAPGEQELPHIYQTGDYWLIPARTATGDVEWPKDDSKHPMPMLAHGAVHHYAPLAIMSVDNSEIQSFTDLRRIMKQRWE